MPSNDTTYFGHCGPPIVAKVWLWQPTPREPLWLETNPFLIVSERCTVAISYHAWHRVEMPLRQCKKRNLKISTSIELILTSCNTCNTFTYWIWALNPRGLLEGTWHQSLKRPPWPGCQGLDWKKSTLLTDGCYSGKACRIKTCSKTPENFIEFVDSCDCCRTCIFGMEKMQLKVWCLVGESSLAKEWSFWLCCSENFLSRC